MQRVFVLLMLVAVGLIVYGEWSQRQGRLVIDNDAGPVQVQRASPVRSEPALAPAAFQPTPTVAATSRFTCDGREHCSQMSSCAEAMYFLQHCPNVKMDGDHDRVPCEDQWCR